ncbi:methylisocitrate lyase [Sulfitobacter brevis]|uniref:Methylisocitrate lyase n=1 Tax=Sulfitobacter brevis TaxID=74348 RepID=A0A1I2BVS4_9RHOB|nr:isocitrate lyase/PEP mutase family protein [Sulfitobacter brevis]SFE60058.1 methylisocitrate lyase [Sulfitobacter brevis]
MTVLTKSEFAQRLRKGETVWAAGAYDALSAKLSENAGFDAVMSTGFGVSASHLGVPDVELYTMTENLGVVDKMVDAIGVPLVADTDTGYGNAINVMRTVRAFEKAGVAAMIFEDQEAPKRCPAVANKVDILPITENAGKIRAAVEARRDADTLIIGRTDSMVEDEAIERACAYVAAGADLIQPISKCFSDIAGLRRLREACGVPLSLQVLGWLETDLSPEEIEEVAGLAVFPLVGLMSATHALQQNLAALARSHQTKDLPMPVTSMGVFKEMIGFSQIERQQDRYLLNPNTQAMSDRSAEVLDAFFTKV